MIDPTNDGLDINEIYLQEEVRQPSVALGLTHNPFPVTGVTGSGESAGGPFYLSKANKAALEEFVGAAIRGQEFCGMAILGEYGSGKTALLKYFEHQAARAQAGGRPIGAYYVSNPGTSFADILQSMTRAIEREVLQKYAWVSG